MLGCNSIFALCNVMYQSFITFEVNTVNVHVFLELDADDGARAYRISCPPMLLCASVEASMEVKSLQPDTRIL